MHHGQHAEADQLIALAQPKPNNDLFSGRTASGIVGDTSPRPVTKLRDTGTAPIASADLSRRAIAVRPPSEHEVLFDRLVTLKVQASQVSMHLEASWRDGLFKQLDCLLDHDNWHFSDDLPKAASFRTFLRATVFNGLKKRPGIGASSDGNIVASWTAGRDRLTVECLPQDKLRYSLVKYVDDERVSAAGVAPAQFLLKALEPYDPEVWFG